MEDQNAPDTVESASKPADVVSADQAGNTSFVWEMLSFGVVPAVGWCALCTYVFWDGPHWYLSIPFGCLFGLILFFVTAFLSALTGNGTTLMELCVGSFITLVLAVVLVPVFLQAKDNVRQQRCAGNVRALSQALTLYTQDNDGSLPPGGGWKTATSPFFPQTVGEEQRTVFFPVKCPTASGNISYALYQPLAGSRLTSLTDAGTTPLVFDADVPVGTLEQLAKPGRHRAGNVIGYADGHVRWRKLRMSPLPSPKLYVRARTARVVESVCRE